MRQLYTATPQSLTWEVYTKHPAPTLLQQAKKADLLKIAGHYGLTEVKQAMQKQHVLTIRVKYFDEKAKPHGYQMKKLELEVSTGQISVALMWSKA